MTTALRGTAGRDSVYQREVLFAFIAWIFVRDTPKNGHRLTLAS
jgi:hypothetical protein